ncbi:MAG: ARPP-1 family domain-containing protein [Hyphomicrobium sp.]
MLRFHLLTVVATAAWAFGTFDRAGAGEAPQKITGPHVHENLAVYFIHGTSAPGPVPLTLAEALEKGRVKVFETGEVNELKIENIGDEAVFIQAGDIVKGGKQDRAVTASLVLTPRSGEVALASFCVEQGRWSSRGSESVARFSSAAEAVPSREAKLAMRAPIATGSVAAGLRSADSDLVYERQRKVWDSVAKTQQKLSAGLSADVAASHSETSLQLSLENDKLQTARAAYVKALQAVGESGDDIVGYAFAVNGKLNSADVYASNGLFRKMWEKQLQSAATEAIGETGDKSAAAPDVSAVAAFLDDAKRGAKKDTPLTVKKQAEVRDGERSVYFASSPAAGVWLHENYLAK